MSSRISDLLDNRAFCVVIWEPLHTGYWNVLQVVFPRNLNAMGGNKTINASFGSPRLRPEREYEKGLE